MPVLEEKNIFLIKIILGCLVFVVCAWIVLYMVFLRHFDYVQALLWNNYKDGKKDESTRPRRTRQIGRIRRD